MSAKYRHVLPWALFLGLFLAIVSLFAWLWPCRNLEPLPEEPASPTEEALPKQEEPRIIDPVLTGEIQRILGGATKDYAVYLHYPNRGTEPYVFGQRPMRSASMIKVFILAAAMEEAKNGRLSLDETIVLTNDAKVGGAGTLAGYPSGSNFSIHALLQHMIAESDNTATNMMIDLLGMDEVNEYMRREGYHDSVLQRKMMDSEAVAQGKENYTSVKDLGTFFTRLYSHQCLGDPYDTKMLEFLLEQEDTECFPAAVPFCRIAHKTGELIGLYDDGGILYEPNGGDLSNDAILVIMDDDIFSREAMLEAMREIAKKAMGGSYERTTTIN